MSSALQNKVAIVTGAATGIGKAIALALGRAGARVVVNHVDTPDSAEDVVDAIVRSGAEAIAVAGDVSSRRQSRPWWWRRSSGSGAGTCSSTTPGSRSSSRSVRSPKPSSRRASRSTSRGPSTAASWPRAHEHRRPCDQHLELDDRADVPRLRRLRRDEGGDRAMTHVISKEFGPRRITVNAVSRGATETETYRQGKSDQFLAGLEAMSAFGRLGEPAEIAAVVAFLATEEARWVTGQNLRVNGGTV